MKERAMLELMTRHPRSIGETYGEHLGAAWSISATLLAASFACLIHGLLPFTFETTASRSIGRLHNRISQRTTPRSGPRPVDAAA
jgi:hypothetical protein